MFDRVQNQQNTFLIYIMVIYKYQYIFMNVLNVWDNIFMLILPNLSGLIDDSIIFKMSKNYVFFSLTNSSWDITIFYTSLKPRF